MINKGRIFRTALVAVTLIFVLSSGAAASNRFKVFGMSDPGTGQLPDSFYSWLNQFGFSHFMTYAPNRAAAYLPACVGDSCVKLYTQHISDKYYEDHPRGFGIYLSADSLTDLFSTPYAATAGNMAGSNGEAEWGYKRNNDTATGDIRSDNTFPLPREVVTATSGTDPAGYLFPAIKEGTFYHTGRNTKPEEMIFEARLRLHDKTGPDSTVVARLIYKTGAGFLVLEPILAPTPLCEKMTRFLQYAIPRDGTDIRQSTVRIQS